MTPAVRVQPRQKKWEVLVEGNKRPTRVTNTKKEAVKIATDMAKKREAELKVCGGNGQIQYRNSYGPDPFPPPG